VQSLSSRGRVGVRRLSESGLSRIRVEPSDRMSDAMIAKMANVMTREKGWKQPGDDGEYRFSIMIPSELELEFLTLAETALGSDTLKTFELNPDWKHFELSEELVGKTKKIKKIETA